MCQVGHLDPCSHQRVLMKTGLILLIIGHLNFITSALVHGTVLRFVVSPRDAISLQYTVTNAASVISALLTISCGAAALMLSRYLAPTTLVSTPSPSPSTQQAAAIPWSVHSRHVPWLRDHPGWVAVHSPASLRCPFSLCLQKWVVFTLSTSSSLGCLSCLLGLAVSIGLTLGSQGRALLAPCTVTDVTVAPLSRDCPFDPTRVYSSTLSLWAISLLLSLMEIIFSIRCLLLTLDLLRLGRCCRGAQRRKVSLQAAPAESPDAGQCLGLLRLDSVETARL
ncbi:transmembrane protein 54 [Podargus strigoides]